tara:strand:+ start:70 stop:510 length:441 start_codon:yes stop_codon:yes gene_type:complete
MLDKLRAELKDALKSSDKDKLNALRNLVAKIKSKEIEKGEPLNNDECLKVCMSSAKQIKESISQFKKGNRQDLADKEKIELDIISSYLPEELSDEELAKIIKEVIDNMSANGPSDMGKVMGPVMGKISGQADGKRVQKLVLEELNR